MIKVKINDKDYSIPVQWSDVTYSQAINVIANVNDKAMQLNALTGIDIYVINTLTDKQASAFFDLISFTENLDVFENDNVLEWAKDFDFGNITYGEAEKCRQLLTGSKNGYETIIDLIKLLKDIDISGMTFTEVIGTANFFLSKSIVFMIVSPSLAKFKQAMSKSKLELTDLTASKALERTLNLQELES